MRALPFLPLSLSLIALACAPHDPLGPLEEPLELEIEDALPGVHRVAEDDAEDAPEKATPEVYMRLASLTPQPDESYLASFDVTPVVPTRIAYQGKSREGHALLAFASTQTLQDERWVGGAAGFCGTGVEYTTLMPPETHRVQAIVHPPRYEGTTQRITTTYGLTSGPIELRRRDDLREQARFAAARREANAELATELRARGFTGEALAAEDVIQALGDQLAATLRRPRYRLPCAPDEFAGLDIPEGLTRFRRNGHFMLFERDSCEGDDLRLSIMLGPDKTAEALRETPLEVERDDARVRLRVAGLLTVELERERGIRRGPLPTRAQAQALGRALERVVTRALLGPR
ncbi:MAG: hypothetical protein KC468_04925 [Myxococcales bacterium]|nr:hypothetical protein [Myxococcales bacterium]